ncbi:MAG: phosphotyrosine protein phosphatase, partial [Caulobacter sp. 39-67-4]
MRPAVLFVCLGNICRSPLAEGAFRAQAREVGLDVLIDSAGTGGWHVGSAPDRRAIATALRHGVDISRQAARKVTAD